MLSDVLHSANDVLNLEIAAGDTQFQANNASMDAFSVFMLADWWMSFYNTVTGVAHYDYSVIGRYIAMPVADNEYDSHRRSFLLWLKILLQVGRRNKNQRYTSPGAGSGMEFRHNPRCF